MAFGLPLRLAGWRPPRSALADLDRLVALHRGVVRLWRHPATGDITGYRPNPALDALLPDEELELALAGQGAGLARHCEILALVYAEERRRRLLDTLERALRRAESHGWPEPMMSFFRELPRSFAWLDSFARFRGLATLAVPRTRPLDEAALDRCEEAAQGFLSEPGALRRTWEVRRFGLANHPGPLVARWFCEGLLLQGLHEAGRDQRAAIGDLLRGLGDELRWYLPEHGSLRPWRGIPPDADSLGLMLQLDDLVAVLPPARIEGWLAWLYASLPHSRRIPTWFYTAPGGGSSIEEPRMTWGSNNCQTARLTCMTGLLLRGGERELDLVMDNLDLVRAESASETMGDDYYGRAWAERTLLRFIATFRRRLPGHRREAELLDIAARIREGIRQAGDGGLGSPQQTAQRLDGLLHLSPERLDPHVLRRALRLLVESQRPDGSWLAEPFYLMPGRTIDDVEWHRSAELTTAICLRAVHLSRRALRGPHAHTLIP